MSASRSAVGGVADSGATSKGRAAGRPLRNLLTVREAATFLRIHPETLRRWVREKRILPCGRAGRGLRFEEQYLVLWLSGQDERRTNGPPA